MIVTVTLFSKIKVENNVFWKSYLINDIFKNGGTLHVFLEHWILKTCEMPTV